jgi:GNAT superfamily N-acetyltransferase
MSATCLLLIVPNLTRGGRPFAVVENVVTLAEHRRKGLGMALMKAAQDRAWAANCYKIMIATGRKDEGVLRFYEEAGFKRGGKTFFEARRLG